MLRRLLGPDPKTLEPVRFSDGLTREVSALLARDERVQAVRLVRERTGLGLVVAVRAVDAQAEAEAGR
jgi:ribosomal protein L7/L12